jgi:hypothetical protein
MSNREEQELVEELDREVSRNGTLVALVACLALGGAMLMLTAMDVLRPG